MSVVEQRSTPSKQHRERMLEGLAASIREKGLANTGVGDIVRHARASRRTFYRSFNDKDACFFALAEAVSAKTRAAVADAVDRDAPWDEQIDQAVDAYLGILAADPKMTVTFVNEISALGVRAIRLRNRGIERYARMLIELASSDAMRDAGVPEVSMDKAVMLMAGLDGMIVRAVTRRQPVLDLAPIAKDVLKAALASDGSFPSRTS
jgi:AcrR family transcriptional regulator